jgi:hypothetical protein
MVTIYDEENEVIGEVEYNEALDHWDGHNNSDGSTGRHLGLTQLNDGRFVLIHGTQWQGESDSAEIVSKTQAAKAIIQSGNIKLFEEYPELQVIRESLPSDKQITSKTFSVRISKNDSKEQIAEKINNMQKLIDEFHKN